MPWRPTGLPDRRTVAARTALLLSAMASSSNSWAIQVSRWGSTASSRG